MTTEIKNPNPTIAEMAQAEAASRHAGRVIAGGTDFPNRFLTRVQKMVFGEGRMLVIQGTEGDRLPEELVGDKKGSHKWISDRMVPEAVRAERILAWGLSGLPRKENVDGISLARAASKTRTFNIGARRGTIAVVKFGPDGPIRDRRVV